ncbi:MAG: HD domain-containing protein, partial [Simkaniaceae bacterium]|nr:HD domain-containing protein [Simkaniaceae bacterium]
MRYAKKVYDSLHGFIHLSEAETKLVYTLPFQRLHYIHQLGVAYLVYPGAVHKRFEHSLGVMHVASKIYDHLIDLCAEDFPDIIPERGSYEEIYGRKVLRLAALCHDLGHLPFSHTAEEALTGIKGHEKWTERMIDSDYLAPVWAMVDPDVEKVKQDVKEIAVGDKGDNPWKHILCKIITADFFGADRIDY